MRILYVWDSDYPWEVRVQKVCRTLADHGHSVEILARNRSWRPPGAEAPEGRITRLRPWTWAGKRLDALLSFPAFVNPRWVHFLYRAVCRARPDLIIVRELPLALTAAWAGRRSGVPVILDMAENYPAMIKLIWTTGRARPVDWIVRNPRAVAMVERWAVQLMDRIWVDVEEQRDRLCLLGVPLPPLDVIRNTPSITAITSPPASRGPRNGCVLEVAYLGILEIQRGVGDLLAAVALLRDRGQRVRAVIIGSGRDEGLFRKQAKELGLADGLIEFAGFLPHEEAIRRVAAADVGVNPIHRNEKHDTTLPNKLFDYMAVGLPVVTSDSAPSARVVRSTGCGEVFRSGDAEDLASALERLLSNEIRARMGGCGQTAVRDNYHWEQDAERLLASVNDTVSPAKSCQDGTSTKISAAPDQGMPM